MEYQTIAERLNTRSWTIDLLDFSYFTKLTTEQWRYSKAAIPRYLKTLGDTNYAGYMKTHGPVEKAGEHVAKSFLDYHCGDTADICTRLYPYSNDCDSPYEPSFRANGQGIGISTRMVRPISPHQPTAINVVKFRLMIPDIQEKILPKAYIFCGFNVKTLEGYCLGWLTSDEVMSVTPVERPNSTYKLRSFVLQTLHTMHTFRKYITSL